MAAWERKEWERKVSFQSEENERNMDTQSNGRMQGCLQSMTKLHGIGGKTTVDPQWQMSLRGNQQR